MNITFPALILSLTAALAGRTRAFKDEILLHDQMALAFDAAGIAYQREVPVQGGGYADFVIEGWCVMEVKASGGGGMAAVRQVLGYLQDPRFKAAVLVTCKRLDLPLTSFTKEDGTIAPIGKIELWKNAL